MRHCRPSHKMGVALVKAMCMGLLTNTGRKNIHLLTWLVVSKSTGGGRGDARGDARCKASEIIVSRWDRNEILR